MSETSGITYGPIVGEPFCFAAVRWLDPKVIDVRYVTRDGSPVLQAGRMWVEGAKTGIEWTDVPTVEEEK